MEALALQGQWENINEGACLYAYSLLFTGDPQDNKTYADFVLLIRSELDSDVGQLEIVLWLTRGRSTRVKISPAGKLDLNADQVRYKTLFLVHWFVLVISILGVSVCRSGGIQNTVFLVC